MVCEIDKIVADAFTRTHRLTVRTTSGTVTFPVMECKDSRETCEGVVYSCTYYDKEGWSEYKGPIAYRDREDRLRLTSPDKWGNCEFVLTI